MTTINLWNGMEIPRIGMGCWAIGGPFAAGDQPLGWGEVDDDESIAAIRGALDLGVRFFDTADVYGAGHSETVLGRALAGTTEPVVVATKFGNSFDPATRQLTGSDASPAYIRTAVDASLRRLGREQIDLYQFHLNDFPPADAEDVFGTLLELCVAGKIGAYGWSTDSPASAAPYARLPGFVAIQHDMNLFRPAREMVAFVESRRLLSINRQPLAMGLLTGKFAGGAAFAQDDIRGRGPDWLAYFRDGRPAPELAETLARVRALLTAGGRSLAQGALGWILARSPATLPIPGFRTVAQVEDNAGAARLGPLDAETMAAIDAALAG